MPVLRTYSNLTKLRRRQSLGGLDTSDNAKLLDKLRAATAQVETWTAGRVFQPISETRQFDYQTPLQCMFRSQDLLQLTGASPVVDQTGNAIPTAAMIMLGGTESAYTATGPFYGMELNPTMGYFLYTTTKTRAISVTGVWGYHTDYGLAWVDSLDTVGNNPLSSSATTITVTNCAAADAYGNYPRINPGDLIQIDTEWLYVIDAPLTGTLSLSGQPSDGDSFTIGVDNATYTYAFKTTITTAGHVAIGTTPAVTMANLVNAMAGENASVGTAYFAGTIPLPNNKIVGGQPVQASYTVNLSVLASSTVPTLAKSGTNLSVSASSLCTSVSVLRGVNGTTAASHNQNAKIYVYKAPADIEEQTLRWAAYLYAQDSVNFTTGTMVPMGATYVQPSLPNDIMTALAPYRRLRGA